MASKKNKQDVDVTETIKEELEIFLPGAVFTTAFGEEIELPKITWKKEKVIFKQVGALFDSVEALKEIDLNEITANQIISLTAVLLQYAPDVLTSIAAEITDLSEEEVDDQLDSSDLMRLLVPFFSGRVQNLTTILQQTLPSSVQ